MCIAGNAKQVLLLILSTILFHVHVTPVNATGIAVALAGSAWYSYVSVMEKEQEAPTRDNSYVYEPVKLEEGDTDDKSDDKDDDSTERMTDDDDSDV